MLEIKKDGTLLLNIFSNINDLYTYCKKTPRRRGANDSSEDVRDGSDWAGTKTLEEAYDKLIHGDDELHDRMKKEAKSIKIEKILGNTYSKNKPFNDVVGFQADVPAYLMGLPQNMINVKPLRRSQKIINFCLNLSVSCSVSREQVERAGTIYANVIDILEKMGYRCNLYVINAVRHSGESDYCLVKVKTDREPFNLKKLCFIFGNAGYLRRVIFKWMESCNVTYDMTHNGYGTPINNKKEVGYILKRFLKTDFIVWDVQNNYKVSIEKVLEDLKESGISLED